MNKLPIDCIECSFAMARHTHCNGAAPHYQGVAPETVIEIKTRNNAMENIIFILITLLGIALFLWLSLPGKSGPDQQGND